MTETKRCPWCTDSDTLMQKYHDHEWGKLNLDEKHLYEMLVLESFQSGLSWSTVLHKRSNFRKAFNDFDLLTVAKMDETDITRLMQDSSIIRNRMKITAAINNAKMILKIEVTQGSFAQYLQQFVKTPIVHHFENTESLPTTNSVATDLARQMKKDGFSFVGPVTIYSYLQSIGLINDHLEYCVFKYHG
ncbi:DNA-3-methyladenine glycosylase I [Lactobacillus sp. ESL0681]|uniref:DNA-3-methyladenine glycosylase I n=1 Tax=Lactobacillus sp. ESL0681 TaxID=2983211 RepID=UPI0023F93CD3|nr:DNA-3-methyladenine glycosylase I [Lactobacillus sp. ESL0681]WEV39679.1 DNA-3-methyladenine glycosylase I [Lactobacillus sp. ESL0681]